MIEYFKALGRVSVDGLKKESFSLPTVNHFHTSLSVIAKSYFSHFYHRKAKVNMPDESIIFISYNPEKKLESVVSSDQEILKLNSGVKVLSKHHIPMMLSRFDVLVSLFSFLFVFLKVVRSRGVSPRSALWRWDKWSMNLLAAIKILEAGKVIVWENLDEPDANAILGLSEKVIGLHGPAPVGVHCSELRPKSIIFQFNWQVEEAKLLDEYILPENVGVIAKAESRVIASSASQTLYLVSSGYWLRKKLDMLFDHEKKGFIEIENYLLKIAPNLKKIGNFSSVVVLPHPREIRHRGWSEEYYAQFDVKLSESTFENTYNKKDKHALFVGGMSTAFSPLGDCSNCDNVIIVVPSWLKASAVAETTFGRKMVSLNELLDKVLEVSCR